MRAPFACFLTGLIAPVLAAAAPAGGQPAIVPPLPAPPASAASDPDAICAAVLGGAEDMPWMLCRNPTGAEAHALARRTAARRHYHAILVARYGDERMARLAIEAAMERLAPFSDGRLGRQADECLARAPERR